MTGNQKKDLRQAWKHIFEAKDEIEHPIPNDNGAKLRILRSLTDAQRLIDRVETERSP